MIKKEIEEVLKERIQTDPNWDYGIEQCWKKEVAILTADISKSIDYLLHECTDEEFYWLGEVFEDIAQKTQSMEFVEALRTRLARVTPESYHQQDFQSEHMRKWVDYAEYVRCLNGDIDYADGQLEY